MKGYSPDPFNFFLPECVALGDKKSIVTHFYHSFSMEMHVKLHTPVPLSSLSDVIAILSNRRQFELHVKLHTPVPMSSLSDVIAILSNTHRILAPQLIQYSELGFVYLG